MTTPTIKIDQSPLSAGVAGSSREDLVVGTPVVITDPANVGLATRSWVLVRPPGSSATISGETTDTATFTPDIPGTYLAFLDVDGDLGHTLSADGLRISSQGGAAIKHRNGTRPLGVGETFQFSSSEGYAEDFHPNFSILDAVVKAVGAAIGTLFYSDASGDLERLAPGTSGQYLKSNGGAAPSWDAPGVGSHGLGGSEHDSATLAQLNAKVSDATLIDTTDARLSDTRTPSSHAVGGAEHAASTLAELSAKVSDATLAKTDGTQTFSGSQNTGVTTLVSASPIAVDSALNNSYEVTLDADRELANPTSVAAGKNWTIRIIQDATGSRALTFGTNYVFGDDNTAPDTSADAANKERLLSFHAVTATRILCVDALGVY